MKYTVVLPPSLGGLVKSIKAGEEEAAFDGDDGNVEVAVVEHDTGSGKVDGVVEEHMWRMLVMMRQWMLRWMLLVMMRQ